MKGVSYSCNSSKRNPNWFPVWQAFAVNPAGSYLILFDLKRPFSPFFGFPCFGWGSSSLEKLQPRGRLNGARQGVITEEMAFIAAPEVPENRGLCLEVFRGFLHRQLPGEAVSRRNMW